MQFIDLETQQKRIHDRIEGNIQKVLDHGQYIMGPEIGALEKRLAAYVGVKHAIACSSGTDALLLALMAYGVGPGDIVFTTPFTFIATAEVVCLLGATPVFVDIDPHTFNIDPERLEAAIEGAAAGKAAGRFFGGWHGCFGKEAQGNNRRRPFRLAGALRPDLRFGPKARTFRNRRRGPVFRCGLPRTESVRVG